MKMHSYYTEIPQRSFEAIVKNDYLSEVLVALLVDPLEAEDIAESIKDRIDAAITLDLNGRAFSAPIGLADFQNLPSKDAFEKLKITLSQWVMTTERANGTLRVLSTWDQRFGAWCSCAVARVGIRFVPKGDRRALLAIETTEVAVRGKSTDIYVTDAAMAAYDASSSARTLAAAAAYASASYAAASFVASVGTSVADNAASLAANAAVRVADAVASVSGRDDLRVAELIRLREVVANACLTFPG